MTVRRSARLRTFSSTGANDVYVVPVHGREILIPAIHDVVQAIDVIGGRIVIHVMPGLFE